MPHLERVPSRNLLEAYNPYLSNGPLKEPLKNQLLMHVCLSICQFPISLNQIYILRKLENCS